MKCHRCKDKATIRMADGEPLCPVCFTKAVNDEVGPPKIIVAKPSDVPMFIDPANPTDFVPMEKLPGLKAESWKKALEEWEAVPGTPFAMSAFSSQFTDHAAHIKILDVDEIGWTTTRMGEPATLNRLGREFDRAVDKAAK